ncbi:MAG TPA: EAL domain-containing protein, partial [Halothiobacillaceae bacterium]|nr:EAL domain-containing protein [Halothiobacillaceae bacterium]
MRGARPAGIRRPTTRECMAHGQNGCPRCSDIGELACGKLDPSSPEAMELRRIFREKALSTVFQPIVACEDGEVIGWEALLRGPEGPLHRPLDLFHAAERHGCLVELDMLARRLALRRFADSPVGDTGQLFLNVMIDSVRAEESYETLTAGCVEALGVHVGRIVIEISELHPSPDTSAIVRAVTRFQRDGFRVALDDVGTGYNGLHLWAETRPDIIKVDR